MFRKLRIPIVIVVTALLTQAVGLAVQAAVPGALRPPGTSRYAAVAAEDEVSISGALDWEDLPGMSQSITIPTGKRGDVFVFFCGMSASTGGAFTLMYVRAMVGGSSAAPSSLRLNSSSSYFEEARCAGFHKLNIPAGAKAVHMEWMVNDLTGAPKMSVRNMIVIVNLHN